MASDKSSIADEISCVINGDAPVPRALFRAEANEAAIHLTPELLFN
jgi:hypothetical protein